MQNIFKENKFSQSKSICPKQIFSKHRKLFYNKRNIPKTFFKDFFKVKETSSKRKRLSQLKNFLNAYKALESLWKHKKLSLKKEYKKVIFSKQKFLKEFKSHQLLGEGISL